MQDASCGALGIVLQSVVRRVHNNCRQPDTTLVNELRFVAVVIVFDLFITNRDLAGHFILQLLNGKLAADAFA